jgi:hypothetical protein
VNQNAALKAMVFGGVQLECGSGLISVNPEGRWYEIPTS